MKKLTALIIMDGFGHSEDSYGNAILAEGTPNIDGYMAVYPHTLLSASGLSVGLPHGQMGNSEVGHTTIGAGRVTRQPLKAITKAIEDGDFFKNRVILDTIEHCKKYSSALHIMGLCSDGGVHSAMSHIYAIVKTAKQSGLDRVYLHCFMDGRDTAPNSGIGFIRELTEELSNLDCGRIATISGRYYAMDRDSNYDRIEKAYAAMVYGEGNRDDDPVHAMKISYENGITDEFILPTVITENGESIATIKENDAVFFANFRPDRARQLTRAFIFEDFSGFERKLGFIPVKYVTMTSYDEEFDSKVCVAFKPSDVLNSLGEYVSKLGMTQLRIAETEKYAHVTFFFNGGVETQYPGEDRVLIPSPKVETYDLKPEMSAYEVADEAVLRIRSGKYDMMIINFANPDMVGHTGVFDAAKKAVKTVDECVGRVVSAILGTGGSCIISADHGNAETMLTPEGDPITAHTTNLVPFILIDNSSDIKGLKEEGTLCDIAPTMLDMMGLVCPDEMEGSSLIIRG